MVPVVPSRVSVFEMAVFLVLMAVEAVQMASKHCNYSAVVNNGLELVAVLVVICKVKRIVAVESNALI